MAFSHNLGILKNTRIEPWIDSAGRWACYIFGQAVTRNGKVRVFRSKEAAIKAGEAYLRYVRESLEA